MIIEYPPFITHIRDYFKSQGWEWKIGGEPRAVTQDDLSKALDNVAETLYSEPIGSQVSVGRLIVRKDTATKIDVYMHVGTIDKE